MPTKTIAVILAAGQGQRLMPLTKNSPKCLLKVGGRPILHHQLSALQESGVKKIFIIVGFMAKVVKTYAIANFPYLDVKFIHNLNHARTNTLYSLALVSKSVPNGYAVLQLNGDVIFDNRVLSKLFNTDKENSYAVARYGKCGTEEIKILLNRKGSIAAINKQISPKNSLSEAVGINKFSPDFWRALSKNSRELKLKRRNDYFEYAVEKTIADGYKIFPMDIERFKAVEIDFPKDLKLARKKFKNYIS